jgi:hypothetical protein
VIAIDGGDILIGFLDSWVEVNGFSVILFGLLEQFKFIINIS